MKTQRDLFRLALERRGWTVAPIQPSKKYLKMTKVQPATTPSAWRERTRWLGKAGALREGPTATQSFAVADQIRKALLDEAARLDKGEQI
jgi:hypothetical protein